MNFDLDIIISPSMVCHADADPIGGLLFGLLALVASAVLMSIFLVLKDRIDK